jgi:transposase
MTNLKAAFFLVHPQRSRKAFEALIENWREILVSYNLWGYRNWINHRQLCLAHLVRKATLHAERADEELFGAQLEQLLQQLVSFAHAPPGMRKWSAFYCPHRGLGEKPSPSGEDLSKLAVWNITVDRAIRFTI